MLVNSIALLAAATLIQAGVLPPRQTSGDGNCSDPPQRIEWRKLQPAQQKSYIDAVLCLKTKPSRIGLRSLFDDFPHVHFQLASSIHNQAPFLPWHRYFTQVYFDALGECGYSGPGTYWDWTLDHDSLLASPVMSPTAGFGGNGNASRSEYISATSQTVSCVDNGPFKDLRPEYLANSPTEITDGGHCFFRSVAEADQPEAWATMKNTLSPEYVAEQQKLGSYAEFAPDLESSPHGTIHASLGGEMNPTTSPNEPLFFLHHPQIDHLWWTWQQQDPAKRSAEYSGSHLPWGGTEFVPASANDTLNMLGLADDVLVKDVLSTTGPLLCYRY
ncbi:monooxygenase [Stagonosporopsis vannaccii]|nr:monooxygenase [Stagonosporopsis vannaccii]